MLFWAILYFHHYFKFLKANEGFTLKMIQFFVVLMFVTVLFVPVNHRYGTQMYVFVKHGSA